MGTFIIPQDMRFVKWYVKKGDDCHEPHSQMSITHSTIVINTPFGGIHIAAARIFSKHLFMFSLTISAFTHIWLAHNQSNIRPNGTDRTHTILYILLSHLLLCNIYSQRYRDVVILESFEIKGSLGKSFGSATIIYIIIYYCL